MENVYKDTSVVLSGSRRTGKMDLTQASTNESYVIKEVLATDEEIREFLFTLGCYSGEKITVISKLAGNFVIAVKDARYSIDKELAEVIYV